MKPVIGVTMGDVCGIGPEIIAKSLVDPELTDIADVVVFGDGQALMRACDLTGAAFDLIATERLDSPPVRSDGGVRCVDPGLKVGGLPYGQVNGAAGHAAYTYLCMAVEAARTGAVNGIVTAPLNKEALHKAGHIYPGHTEILAELTDTDSYAMMLATPKLKVIHLTTHTGLIDAIKSIDPERSYQVIRFAHDVLKRSGNARPRIAFCGINPHAGENGLFGYGEEEEKLIPAIRRAQGEGVDVSGPWPADTIFFRAFRGDFDIVIACYHDQGHIPVKLLSLEEGVNITVGLKGGIIRTSVDHGTAFDIAGRNIANHSSLVAAARIAVELMPDS